ncbi:hypothetical protein HMPREF1870_01236 [Bacteroidales bacterium KA00344]|nr:hypothetical protein HMPREF1870_01236 [Bacteroidales bacterium KA00344]
MINSRYFKFMFLNHSQPHQCAKHKLYICVVPDEMPVWGSWGFMPVMADGRFLAH